MVICCFTFSACATECATCTEGTASKCSACKDGYYLQGTTCTGNQNSTFITDVDNVSNLSF